VRITTAFAGFATPTLIDPDGNTQSHFDGRIALVVSNIAVGLIVVFATMWQFALRQGNLWTSAGLPVSVLGRLGLTSPFGITISKASRIAP